MGRSLEIDIPTGESNTQEILHHTNEFEYLPWEISDFKDDLDLYISYTYLKSIGIHRDISLQNKLTDFILNEVSGQDLDYSLVKSLDIDFNTKEVIFILKDGKQIDGKNKFRIYIGDYVDEELDNPQREGEKISAEIKLQKQLEYFENSIDVLDDFFKNSGEFFIEGNEKLSENHYLERFNGKSITEAGYMIRADFHKTHKELIIYASNYGGNSDGFYDFFRQKLTELEERYLYMFMGIGDKYEEGASVFTRSKSEIETILGDIVLSKKTNGEVFDFMIKLHSDIDDNNYQDAILKDVNGSYPSLIEMLHGVVLTRLKESNAPDEDFLNYARIVTGRDVIYTGEKGEKEKIDVNTDYDLNRSKYANEALLFVMFRTGGFYDKLNTNDKGKEFSIIDEEIGDQKPKDVIDEFKSVFKTRVLNEKGEPFGDLSDKLFEESGFDKSLGLEDILGDGELSGDYQKLNIYQKIRISTVKRLTNKLLNYQIPLLGIDSGIANPDKSMLFVELYASIESIEQDATKAVLDGFGKHFDEDGKNNRVYLSHLQKTNGGEEFSETELDIFELYNDMNGYGDWTELSDDTLSLGLTIGGFASVIALSILLLMVTAGGSSALGFAAIASAINTNVLLQGTLAGMYGSISSWAIFPQGYSSKEKMIEDLLSDLAIGGGTGALGGRFAQGWESGFLSRIGGNPNARLFENSLASWKNKGIFIGDLAFLGIGTEIWRNNMVQGDYAGDSTLFDGEFTQREGFDFIGQFGEREIKSENEIITYQDGIQAKKTETGYEIISGEETIYIDLYENGKIKKIKIGEREFSVLNTYVYFSKLDSKILFTTKELKVSGDRNGHNMKIKELFELLNGKKVLELSTGYDIIDNSVSRIFHQGENWLMSL